MMLRALLPSLLCVAACGDSPASTDALVFIDAMDALPIDAPPASIVGFWAYENADGVLDGTADIYNADGTLATNGRLGTWRIDGDLLVRSLHAGEESGAEYHVDASTLMLGVFHPLGAPNGAVGSWTTHTYDHVGDMDLSSTITIELHSDTSATITRESSSSASTIENASWTMTTPTAIALSTSSSAYTIRWLGGSTMATAIYQRR
jgi:hypothetical protein